MNEIEQILNRHAEISLTAWDLEQTGNCWLCSDYWLLFCDNHIEDNKRILETIKKHRVRPNERDRNNPQ